MRFPEARLRGLGLERAHEITKLRSGSVPRYKRIPIEIMKINDVKAPSRLQLIIATARAADRPTVRRPAPSPPPPPPSTSSTLLLQHNRDINPSLIPAAKGRRATRPPRTRARARARLILWGRPL